MKTRYLSILAAAPLALTAAIAMAQNEPAVSPPAAQEQVAPGAPAAPVETPAPVVTPEPAAPAAAPVEPAAVPPPASVAVPSVAAQASPLTVSPDNNTISIQLDSVPVDQVVRMFSRAANANIVAGSLPQTNVTVNLTDVPWEPALKEILGQVGLTLVQRNAGIYAVVSTADLSQEPITSDILFLNYTTATNIVPLVERMVAGITNATVAGFNGANAVVVRAPASSLTSIKQVIEKIDKPRDQVLIECKFVELNDQAIKDIGINWQTLQGWNVALQTPQLAFTKTDTDRYTRDNNLKERRLDIDTDVEISDKSKERISKNGESSTASGSLPSGVATATKGVTDSDNTTKESLSQTTSYGGKNYSAFDPVTGVPVLVPGRDKQVETIKFGQTETLNVLTSVLSADTFAATLSALKQNDGVEIVSNPKVIVASGETAQIHVGRNEPNVVAVPSGDTGDRFAYKLDDNKPFIEIGVKLNVTPVLNTSNNITLKIQPELSRKLGDKAVGEAGTSYPITSTRKVTTEFNIESGRTVAIGGLTETTDQESVKKIPILGDIPIIGTYLFRHTHTEKVQDETIIFVTASSASPGSLAQVSGIPEEAKLVHRHLAKKVDEAAKAEELARKKAQKASLPK